MSDNYHAENCEQTKPVGVERALAPSVRDDAIDSGIHCANFWCKYYDPEYLWACRGTLRNGDPAVSTCEDYVPEGFGC